MKPSGGGWTWPARVADMVLCHKGAAGAEKIAAPWAKARKVPQILFRPNWPAHNRRAPYLANDDMIAARIRGVILFGGNGIALSLRDKGERKGFT